MNMVAIKNEINVISTFLQIYICMYFYNSSIINSSLISFCIVCLYVNEIGGANLTVKHD